MSLPLRLRTWSTLSQSSLQVPTAGNLLNNTLFINLFPFPVSFPCFPTSAFWHASKKVTCTGIFVAGTASGGTQTQTHHFTEAPPAAWLSQASSMPSHISQTPAPIVWPGQGVPSSRYAKQPYPGRVLYRLAASWPQALLPRADTLILTPPPHQLGQAWKADIYQLGLRQRCPCTAGLCGGAHDELIPQKTGRQEE